MLTINNVCQHYLKPRLPICTWLPQYKLTWLIHDALAGLTVGLTAIPQGIAYAIVAGLSPEYGLYAGFMASFVYIIFGSCKNITIGTTAIMATMVQSFVLNYGPNMAILLAFLKGCIIMLSGILHLGFLLDFISLPVITGFTSAAAINIASSQFKQLFGIPGRTEGFLDSVEQVFSNLNAIRYQDTILGICTIIVLAIFKKLPGKRDGTWLQKVLWILISARNAVVVVAGTIIAYVFHYNGYEIFKLTGSMGKGLPPFKLPPFSTTFKNKTYNFVEMITIMGSTIISISIISTIEHIAIAKVFAKGKSLDATQEMFALGISNILGSFVSSMPITGSFTRTAVNHASGVKTPLGGLFTGCLVLLAAGFLTNTFRYIPKATLAGVIIFAMYYLLDFSTYLLIWRAKKVDFVVMIVTFLSCIFLGLELGIAIGIVSNLVTLLYFSAKPSFETRIEQNGDQRIIYIIPEEAIAFPAAEHLRANIMKLSEKNDCNVVLDLKNLKRIDVTVAKNIKLLANDLSLRGQEIIYINSCKNIENVLKTIAPELQTEFRGTIIADMNG
uniref:sodium-independent sulfate anion transporter-like isoform X1 n=1 Tax=Vespula vulgaris TaxID=7454 RepID=UPI00214451C7|nr:sodium-independent sulfate anion transporter-like isoform X1 [Vespula vulgaris]